MTPTGENPTLAALFEDVPDADALGRLLWQLVALAHERGLNAEDALRTYAVGFRERVADGA